MGIELSHVQLASGTVYLDYLTWNGAPETVLANPGGEGLMWRRAWVNGVDQYEHRWHEAYCLMQNYGRGILSQGTREWSDYTVTAEITLGLVKAAGLAACVQGMRRYYALLLCDDQKARLVKALDGDKVLAVVDHAWQYGQRHSFELTASGQCITASLDGFPIFDVRDVDAPHTGGGIALVVEEGRVTCDAVSIRPI